MIIPPVTSSSSGVLIVHPKKRSMTYSTNVITKHLPRSVLLSSPLQLHLGSGLFVCLDAITAASFAYPICIAIQVLRTYLWNPCLHKFKRLPPPSIRPDCPSFLLGFGVNPHCFDDLMVVRGVFGRKLGSQEMYDGRPDIEIYSLSTGKWRRISAIWVNLCQIDFMWSQTFAHGAIHWIGAKWQESERCKCCIIVFSMADKVFSEIMLPDELVNDIALNLTIMAFDESIAVAKYGTGIHGDFCELWMMKEYGVVKSWCKLHHIELVEGMERIVGFRKNGDILISTDKGELASYCPSTEVVNRLGIYGSIPSFYAGKYLESLVLFQEHSCVIDGLSEEMTSMSI